MKQTCILVLGMHRSGTSALTGLLSILDVYLGSELMEENFANIKGYFENNLIYKINEKLLKQIDSSWDDVFFNEEKILNIEGVDELKNKIKKEFEYSNVFAIKDPRIVFLFPLYKKILEELDIDIKIILPYRNPIEVASSLNRRDGFCYEKGMLLWAYHFLLAEKYSREFDRVFVSFDELISNTKETITLISEQLDIDFHTKYLKYKKQINDFLEPGLKHHNLSIDNLSENTAKIIREILQLQNEFNDSSVTSKLDELREDLFRYQRFFYNQDVIRIFTDLETAKLKLVEADQKLLENSDEIEVSKQLLVELDQGLQARTEELVTTRRQLSDVEQDLQNRIEEIEEGKQRLSEANKHYQYMEKQLDHKNLYIKEVEQRVQQGVDELEKNNLKLINVESDLQEANLVLLQREHELNTLKDELTAIYIGRSWKVTRPLRKLKGMFK